MYHRQIFSIVDGHLRTGHFQAANSNDLTDIYSKIDFDILFNIAIRAIGVCESALTSRMLGVSSSSPNTYTPGASRQSLINRAAAWPCVVLDKTRNWSRGWALAFSVTDDDDDDADAIVRGS